MRGASHFGQQLPPVVPLHQLVQLTNGLARQYGSQESPGPERRNSFASLPSSRDDDDNDESDEDDSNSFARKTC